VVQVDDVRLEQPLRAHAMAEGISAGHAGAMPG
jgi:hypothetical protein